MSTQDRNRQPHGQPTGGQFAEEAKGSSGIALAGPGQAAPQPVQTADELREVVREALGKMHGGSSDHMYYLDEVNEHLGGMDANEFEDDFFFPMAVALDNGQEDEALGHAQRAMGLVERERRWRNHPTFTEPTFTVAATDPMYGNRVEGAKYDQSRSMAETGKLLRSDIKEAVDAGYLPDGLDYRVQTSEAGGRSISVYASGFPDEDYYSPGRVYGEPEAVMSRQANIAEDRLETLAEAYTSQQSNSQVDYFNHSAFVRSRVYSRADQRIAEAGKAIDRNDRELTKVTRAGDDEAASEAAKAVVASRDEQTQAMQDRADLIETIKARAAAQ